MEIVIFAGFSFLKGTRVGCVWGERRLECAHPLWAHPRWPSIIGPALREGFEGGFHPQVPLESVVVLVPTVKFLEKADGVRVSRRFATGELAELVWLWEEFSRDTGQNLCSIQTTVMLSLVMFVPSYSPSVFHGVATLVSN